MEQQPITRTLIGIKGAGEMASAVAWRLYTANFRNIFMMETPKPQAVRRRVCFCEAVYDKSQTVENVSARLAAGIADIEKIWSEGAIALIVDPKGRSLASMQTGVLIDAVLAKRNLGTRKTDAPLVIGLGPGFTAGDDVHLVIETNRGHDLGRIITSGCAQADTGIPGAIGGYTSERILRAPCDGVFTGMLDIGNRVTRGTVVGKVGEQEVRAEINGILRGRIRSGCEVHRRLKLGDIDPRGVAGYCDTISDKARAISGSVLEATLRKLLEPSSRGCCR